MNIVVAGEGSAGLQVLKELARSDHHVCGVFCTPPASVDEARSSIWTVARKLGFETWPAHEVKDSRAVDRLRGVKVDLLLNVHSLYVVNRELLAVPLLGGFNLHPGPLPRYAGLNVISWAIYRGEKSHGVTVHKMEATIDAGAIAYQECFPIEDDDTAFTVSFKGIGRGVKLILRLLEDAAVNPHEIPLDPQDLSRRTYFGPEVPDNGWIAWGASAEQVVNFVRACDYFPFRSPWGQAKTCLGDREVTVLKARRTGLRSDRTPGAIGELSDSGVHVAAGDEWILVERVGLGNQQIAAAEVLKSGDSLSVWGS